MSAGDYQETNSILLTWGRSQSRQGGRWGGCCYDNRRGGTEPARGRAERSPDGTLRIWWSPQRRGVEELKLQTQTEKHTDSRAAQSGQRISSSRPVTCVMRWQCFLRWASPCAGSRPFSSPNRTGSNISTKLSTPSDTLSPPSASWAESRKDTWK